LVQLANALIPIVNGKEPLEEALAAYGETFTATWHQMLAEKLGLSAFDGERDEKLLTGLFELLQAVETDMTLFFRLLASVPTNERASDIELASPLERAFYDEHGFGPTHLPRLAGWLRSYIARVHDENISVEARKARMNRVNPKYVLRNY